MENKKLCYSCMKEHEIEIVNENEKMTFKGIVVEYKATYEYCSNTETYSENEEMMRQNGIALRDAYRKKMDLLTTKQMKAIRIKYKINQKDFAKILGWGEATLARYESHYIQERANDNLLRKVGTDPEWFLLMLEKAKERINGKSYEKYFENAKGLVEQKKDPYLINSFTLNYYADSSQYKSSNSNYGNYENPTPTYKNVNLCGIKYYESPVSIPEKYSLAA